jgi:hypothetical protein
LIAGGWRCPGFCPGFSPDAIKKILPRNDAEEDWKCELENSRRR